MSVYRCIANLKGKVCRNADPRGKYADTPIRARRMARCIGVSVRAGRVAGYVGVSVHRRCEGKSMPTRSSTRQIRTPIRRSGQGIRRYAGTPVRRYADPGRKYADTPIRRYADTPIRAGNTPIRRYAGTPIRRSGQGGYIGVSVYRCIGAELFRRRDPGRKYADTPIRRYAGTPIRRSGQEIRRYADTPVRRYADPGREYADTPIRRYADTPIRAGRVYRCIGVSVRSCIGDAVCGLSGMFVDQSVAVPVRVAMSVYGRAHVAATKATR